MTRPILRQKLAPPPLWKGALRRHRLETELDAAIARGQHIGLFAGAGYGKTTVLAAWARERQAVWITLDAEDADLDAFLAYLTAAFERALPGFRSQATDMLARARERTGALAVVSTLLGDLDEQVERPVVLVIDEYHRAASPSLDTLLAWLLKYLPESIRLVIAARKLPEVELASLQAGHRLHVLDEPALAFDLAELGELQPKSSPTAARELLATTGGWPAAMGMTPQLLDAYLDEQLLSGQSAAQRAFLQRLALVDVFDAELCEEALGEPLTPERREALLQDRLISPLGGERFSLHPALRGLLLRRFPVDVRLEERRKLLRRVGDYYWRLGQSATALRFWIDAGELSWAAERLVAVAGDWLAEGRLEALASAIDALGAEGEQAELLVARGELYRRWGDLMRAEQFFERAVEACGGDDQSLVRARARLGQAQVAGSRGDVTAARARLAEARPRLVGEPRFELDVLILEGGLALLSAETELAIASFRAALDLGQRQGDPYAEGRAMHNLGICYIRQGEFERALECYDSALERDPEDGTPTIWMTPINRALVLVHLGRLAEAEAAAEAALDLVRRYKLTREEGYALRILGFSRLRRGAFESAASCFDSAELLARRANDTLGLAYSLNFRAELAIAEGDFKAATELVEDVERAMGGVEATRGILEFAQTRARLCLAAGRQAEARAVIEDLLERARALGYKHVLDQTELMAAELRQPTPGSPVPVAEPVHAPAPPTELRVSCFGGLRVWRSDAEVSDREWQTARAKLLLAFFLFNPEGATKAHLLEAVFPQEEISNALMNMTLMRVRKALEPGLEKGLPSRFILRSDGRYSFNLQAHVELDTREFEHQLRGARLGEPGERAALERALALYRGDFLPEFDTRWVVALRHRYQELALKACRRLLELYDEQAPDEVAGLLQRALEIDPVSEEFNRELILRYLEADEPHRALQHFQLCERRFREILDVPPPADLAKLVARKST